MKHPGGVPSVPAARGCPGDWPGAWQALGARTSPLLSTGTSGYRTNIMSEHIEVAGRWQEVAESPLARIRPQIAKVVDIP